MAISYSASTTAARAPGFTRRRPAGIALPRLTPEAILRVSFAVWTIVLAALASIAASATLDATTFSFFTAAVVATALFAGPRAGLLATTLSVPAALVLVFPQANEHPGTSRELVRLALYVAICLPIIGLAHLRRQADQRHIDSETRLRAALDLSEHISQELRETNEAKDEFLSMISHELRTPTTTIVAGAHLLNKGTLNPMTQREVVADVYQESQRLELIIENLLAVGRENLAGEQIREPISLPGMIAKVANSHRRLRGREVAINVQKGIPVMTGVPVYVELVLRNLLDNAVKYSPEGTPISIVATGDDAGALVSVLDRGPGVPESEVEHIFEDFYRSERTAMQASGVGMGLAVCKRLIEAQGNRIWARLREGGGLQVTFSLHAYDEEPGC
jgi:K+-sensing histidine kinase KdpD